jgi:hypothetical protein
MNFGPRSGDCKEEFALWELAREINALDGGDGRPER